MWLGIVVIIGFLLFPPWHLQGTDGKIYYWGHALIFTGPHGTPLVSAVAHIDYSRLLLPIAAVIMIAIGLIVTFRDQKPK